MFASLLTTFYSSFFIIISISIWDKVLFLFYSFLFFFALKRLKLNIRKNSFVLLSSLQVLGRFTKFQYASGNAWIFNYSVISKVRACHMQKSSRIVKCKCSQYNENFCSHVWMDISLTRDKLDSVLAKAGEGSMPFEVKIVFCEWFPLKHVGCLYY